MIKPFDVTPKSMSEWFPEQWCELLEWEAKSVELIDADVATVSGAADKIIRVHADPVWLGVLEFLSSYKPSVPERLHWHSTLIGHRHQLLVRSVAILLRPEADGPGMTGEYLERFPGELPHLTFRYRVLRLWEIPVERLLNGGLGLALFAPLGKTAPEQLREVVRQVRKRVNKERSQDAPDLLAAMYILMGLRYDESVIQTIKMEVSEMEESITYQEILKKGEVKGEARGKSEGKKEGKKQGHLEEAREFIVLMAADRLGSPTAAVRRKLQAIEDLERLHQIGRRIHVAATWKELLATN